MQNDERMSLAPVLSPLPSLRPFDPRDLDVDPAVICALTKDLRISFVNEAWASFAKDNGAQWGEGEWGVGTRILDAVPRVLQSFYRRLFDSVLLSREETEHEYECSSVTQQRRFRMTIYPCVSGGLVLVHSLISETPQLSAPSPEEPSAYRDGHGLVHQCCHCRRVRRASDPAAWDWVPAFVDSAASNVSHGLCRVCAQYYYPPAGDLES